MTATATSLNWVGAAFGVVCIAWGGWRWQRYSDVRRTERSEPLALDGPLYRSPWSVLVRAYVAPVALVIGGLVLAIGSLVS